MEETIGNVLRRVIVPAFSRINDVVVRQMGLSDLYYITFYINDRIDYHDAFMIEKETKNISLFTCRVPLADKISLFMSLIT